MSHLYGAHAVNGTLAVNAATHHTSDRDVDLHVSFSRVEGWETDFMLGVYFTPTKELRRRVAMSASGEVLGDTPHNVHRPKTVSGVRANVTGLLASSPTETSDTAVVPALSKLPWHAVYLFEASDSRGSFTFRVPKWVTSSGNPQCLNGYGIWLFTRRKGHKLQDGGVSSLWEREAHGWGGTLKRMDGSRVCTTTIKMTTSSTEMQTQMEWLLRDFSHHVNLKAQQQLVHAHNAQVCAFWHESQNWPTFKNLHGLGKWYDSSRAYPVYGMPEKLPMFAHLVPITFDVPVHPQDTPNLFNRLASLGAGRLGYTPTEFVESTKDWHNDSSRAALLMELTSEICTMWLHAIDYTVDRQHGQATDEWEFLNNTIDHSEARFDCEDGSEYIVRMVKTIHAMSGLRTGTFNPSSAMSTLMCHVAEFVAIYEPCMVLCTLRLQGQGTDGMDAFTYHACVVMLDRDYLEMHSHLILKDEVRPIASSGAVAFHAGSPDGGVPVSADPDAHDVGADGVIQVGESAGSVALRHEALGAAARHAILTDFHTAFVLESTTYVSAARFPLSATDKGSVDDLVFTVKTDKSLPEIMRMGDGSIKLSNSNMYGEEGEHRFYGRVLFFISPFMLDRGLTDMVLYDERTPGTKSVPMLDFLNYADTIKIQIPSDEGGDYLGDFVRAVEQVMQQMPMFLPIGTDALKGATAVGGDLVVVSEEVTRDWWPYYLRPFELAGFFAVLDVDANDNSKVRQHSFEVCHGVYLVQVLIHKSLSAKHGSMMTRRFVYG